MKLLIKIKHLFVEVLLIILLINLTSCHMQEASTTAPATQTHWQRPVQHTTRNTVTRWKVNQTPSTSSVSTSHNCDYKELITNLHDRISLLATVDEDLRKRLDNIEKKIVQFESSNLARMDSLAVQQTDFGKRMDVTEHIQRLTRHGVDQLLGEFEEYMKTLNHTHIITDNRNHSNDKTDNDLNVLRKARQTDQRPQQQQPQTQSQVPQGVFSISDSQKLDALATLLTSTRVAVNGLQAQLQANVTKLMQTTGNLQRRFNNLFRRQQNQGGLTPLVPNFYAAAGSGQQLTTSCAQGVAATNGILKLQLTPNSDPFYVACDDELLGGGWTVIMNRFNGDINFQRGWLEYKHGFGNLAGEFFIGLEKLYALTASSVHELLITLEDFDNNRKYARYNLFAIGNEQESYELKLLGKYEGDAGDSFSYHAGSKFSTFDNDNDGCVDCNCAQSHKGAWWYNWCDQSNLMGPYHDQDFNKIEQYRGMYWQDWLGPNYSLKAAKMMIRPLNVEQDARR
ncbi:fibrinogen-like protein 1 isoform X1 [Lucilia sericata]|uniref:fibrinogen-like protein 1 isoform X1 n=1 Tax=Lucilia sericata TaxID=13632 RepID=UPI0018A7FFF1|nr:fibrinogen-like protein 1 isoform X1 [Lucilia sericata]